MGRNVRDRLSRLVARLPDADVEAMVRFGSELATCHDPLKSSLRAAPEEDEELSPEERRALEEGLADKEAGRVFSAAEVERELGL